MKKIQRITHYVVICYLTQPITTQQNLHLINLFIIYRIKNRNQLKGEQKFERQILRVI